MQNYIYVSVSVTSPGWISEAEDIDQSLQIVSEIRFPVKSSGFMRAERSNWDPPVIELSFRIYNSPTNLSF